MTKQYKSQHYVTVKSKNSSVHSESRIQSFDEQSKKKQRVRISKLHWEQIPRANEPSKPLQEKAINLLAVIVHKLRVRDSVIFNHAYLSRITKCKKGQNVNLLKQLDNLLHIQFHTKININGKKYRNVYVINHSETGRSIIENSQIALMQSYFIGNNLIDPISNRALNENVSSSSAQKIKPFSIYKKKEYIKYRSIESKFEIKNDLSFLNKTQQPNKAEIVETKKTPKRKKKQQSNKRKKPTNQKIKLNKTKTLEESINSITEQEAIEIRKESGRDFCLNAIKKLLKSFLNKGFKPLFHSSKGEIAWISKMLRQEMRQAIEVNKTTFIPKINLTPEEIKAREEEKYLAKIEYSLEVSPEWHLKKKLAAVLERNKAYEILKSYKSLKIEPDGRCKLSLDKAVELTKSDKEIILSQIKATHEIVDKYGNYQAINSLQIVALTAKIESCNAIEQTIIEYEGIWGKIRKSFIDLMRYDGEGIDRSWLSGLTPKVDEKNQIITLKAKSPFFRDWIKANYLNQLSRISDNEFGFTIEEIIC